MIFTRRDIELGEKARSVVENEAFKTALEGTRSAYTQAFINTAEDESAKRERAYMAIRMLDEVEANLIGMMDKGRIAKASLDKLNRK